MLFFKYIKVSKKINGSNDFKTFKTKSKLKYEKYSIENKERNIAKKKVIIFFDTKYAEMKIKSIVLIAIPETQ